MTKIELQTTGFPEGLDGAEPVDLDGGYRMLERVAVPMLIVEDGRAVGYIRAHLIVTTDDDEPGAPNVVRLELGLVRHEGGLRSWAQLPPPDEIRQAALNRAVWRMTSTATASGAEVEKTNLGSIEERERDLVHERLRPRQRRKITDAFLDRVASVYRDAIDDGTPRRAVAEEFGVSESQAAKYVRLARQQKKLGATKPGQPGELARTKESSR